MFPLRRPSRATACLLALTTCASIAISLAVAAQGVVRMKDGSSYEGEIREENMMVIVKSRHGIELRIKRELVDSIEYHEDTELEFNRRYKALDPQDAAERIKLARFALDNRRPDLARTPLIEALQIDPNNKEASSLYEAVKVQLELARRAQSRAESAPTPRPSTRPPSTSRPSTTEDETQSTRPPHRPLLSSDQINLIRQAELREGDNSVQIKFEDDVEKRYAQARAISLNAFRQLTPVSRFFDIRKNGGQAFLKDIRILRDPVSLAEYRKLQGRILAGCATSGCHGGGDGGSFFMISPAENDAATYTNFYLIAKGSFDVTRASGEVSRLRMIDRTSPEISLLLQYALDPKIARFPHPKVDAYRPIFRSENDPGFVALFRWVSTSLSPLEPDYGFTFGPERAIARPTPTPDAAISPSTTAPSTAPSTNPSTHPQPSTSPSASLTPQP